MEQLIIKSFAGLQDVEITINKINIIIGPQASGKSVIAKLLLYFRGFIRAIFLSGIEQESKRLLDKKLKDLFEQYFPPDSWGASEFIIQYSLDNHYIEVKRVNTKRKSTPHLDLAYSDFFKKSLSQVRSLVKKTKDSIGLADISQELTAELTVYFEVQREFLRGVAEKLGRASSFNQLFIPAGRSLFAIYDDNIFGFLSKDLRLDPLLIQLGQHYEKARHLVNSGLHQATTNKKNHDFLSDFNKLKNRILVGKYMRLQGKDYIQSPDGRAVRLSYSSSGQQEILPLVLILESLCFFPSGVMGNSAYIEEPEAHLFPSAQRDIVNLIATAYNAQPTRSQFFLTTHSPYILTAFNNLIQAGILIKSGHHDQVLKVIPASQILDPNDVAAYHVVDGKARNIIDPETQLIDAQIIDSISEELAIQFDQLLDIE